MKLCLALLVAGMTKGVIVLYFFLSFSEAKQFLVDVEDETLEDITLEDGNDLAGNDYGNTS